MVRNIPTVLARSYGDGDRNRSKNGRSGGSFADMGRIPTYGMAIQTAQVAQCDGFGGIGRYGAGCGKKYSCRAGKELRRLLQFCPDSLIGENGVKTEADRLRGIISRIRESLEVKYSLLARECKPSLVLDLRRLSNRICDSVFVSLCGHYYL